MEKIITLQHLLLAASTAANRAPNENQREELHTLAAGLENLLVRLHRKSKRDVQLPRLMAKLFIPTCLILIVVVATLAGYKTEAIKFRYSFQIFLIQGGIIALLTFMSIFMLRKYTAIDGAWNKYVADFAPTTGSEKLTKKELGQDGLDLEWAYVDDKNASRPVKIRGMELTLPGGPAWRLFMSELEHIQTKATEEPASPVN